MTAPILVGGCTLHLGDCRDVLRTLPAASMHCCVTSPPYFWLRDYGVDGQIGLEPTPSEFVSAMVAVFREVRRVLRGDGTLWLNLGDSYAGSASPNAGRVKGRLAQMAGCLGGATEMDSPASLASSLKT